MSEQNAEQSSGDSGSLLSGPAGPDLGAAQQPLAPSTPEAAKETTCVVSPDLSGPAVDPGAPALTGSGQVAEQVTEAEARSADDAGIDATTVSGEIYGFSPTNHDQTAPGSAESGQETVARRRFPAIAAAVALATVAGAMGGALATAGLRHFASSDVASAGNSAVEVSMARIEADLAALKSNLEHTARLASTQSGKAGERLDKLEKAQAEPAAKLAKLSEAIDKLRAASTAATIPVAASSAAAAPVAAKEVTGSIQPSAAGSKPEVARLPTVAGWTLRDVANGGALIENRQGLFEVYAGDAVPGLGRIDAIRRQDGRWVVVTAKGLIVTR